MAEREPLPYCGATVDSGAQEEGVVNKGAPVRRAL